MHYSRDAIDQCGEPASAGTSWYALLGNAGCCRFACFAILVAALFSFGSPIDAHGSATFRKALRAAQSGKLDRAVQLWTIVIKRNPKSYAAYVNRGSAHLLSGNVLEGLRDWHKANECAPVFAYGVYASGFVQEADRNPALLGYAMSLELDPDYIPSVVMIGAFYQDLALDETAIELYRLSTGLTRNPMLKNHLNHWMKTLGGESEE